jgi:hypothetical protein
VGRQREDRIESLTLRHVADRIRRSIESVFQRSREQRNEADDAAQQRGLPCSVRPEQGNEVARFHRERHVLEDSPVLVAEARVP